MNRCLYIPIPFSDQLKIVINSRFLIHARITLVNLSGINTLRVEKNLLKAKIYSQLILIMSG